MKRIQPRDIKPNDIIVRYSESLSEYNPDWISLVKEINRSFILSKDELCLVDEFKSQENNGQGIQICASLALIQNNATEQDWKKIKFMISTGIYQLPKWEDVPD